MLSVVFHLNIIRYCDEATITEIKYSPSTFKYVKMSSFFHFLFYIVIISTATRGLSQGGKLSPMATVRDPLASNQKKT